MKTRHGSYRLEAAVQATATAQDRKRLTAEALLVEANELSKQSARTAQQVIEKSEQALLLWRELGEPSQSACSLRMIGSAYYNLSRFEKPAEQRAEDSRSEDLIGARNRPRESANLAASVHLAPEPAAARGDDEAIAIFRG